MINETTAKWVWMMDWCKQRGLPPANSDVWARADEAYFNRKEQSCKQ